MPRLCAPPGPHGVDGEADDGEPDDAGPAAIHQKSSAMRSAPARRVQHRLRPPATNQHQRTRRHDPPAGGATTVQPGDVVRYARGEVRGVGHGMSDAMRRHARPPSLPPLCLL